jgi:hypothetical protein
MKSSASLSEDVLEELRKGAVLTRGRACGYTEFAHFVNSQG